MTRDALKKAALAAVVAALLGMAACAKPPGSDVGLVDENRITSNWPKFLNFQNQLNADAATIQQSHSSPAEKQRQMQTLTARFQSGQTELTNDVRNAAEQVASARHLRFVLSRQAVGYGGIDITSDVEKLLQITERGTPAP